MPSISISSAATTATSRTCASWRARKRRANDAGVQFAGSVREAVAGPSDSIASFGGGPVVFRGLCASWAACDWDAATVCAAMPELRVSRSDSGTFPYDGGQECPGGPMASAEFFRRLRSAPPHLYCHGNVLPDALARDAPTPPLLRGCSVARRSLWISGSGASSPLHYDLPNVLLCQLHGSKVVHLYSPALHDEMAPRAETFPALAAHERIATTRRADLGLARSLSVTLRAGDALFMPPGWWHDVTSVGHGGPGMEACVSVGLNWPEVGDAIGLLAPWKRHTRYPILTQGDVLARHYGPERAGQMAAQVPGWCAPVF